jgi:hypothetical protein
MRTSVVAVSLLLLGEVLVSCPVSADCVEYEDYMHLVGGVGIPLFASSVAVSGTYACNTGSRPYPSDPRAFGSTLDC